MSVSSAEAASLYLDLLKRSLTNSIHEAEPDADGESEARFMHGMIGHYFRGPAVSMLPLARLDNLQTCIADVLAAGVPGDLIETGVWRGGAAIFMRAILKIHAVTDRTIWAADSFEGLPEPDAERFPAEAKHYHGPLMKKTLNNLTASFEEVQRNFAAYGMLDDQVKFLKGWFKDTLPRAPIKQLAILRLDGDYYESTWDALTALYDKVSIGGYVIIDDYGEERWTYCAEAVEDFRQRHAITEPLHDVDTKCRFWKREV